MVQGAEEERLIDRDPFDRVYLDAANDNKVFDVLPLDLPNRRVPDPLPRTGTIEARLVDAPTRPYQIRWVNIVQIKLYPQLLLDEAIQLTRADKFDDAYDYLVMLADTDRNLPGLAAAMDNFLYRNAFASFQAGQHEDALSIISALYERNPEWPGLGNALNRIVDELIKVHVEQGEFKTARQLLDSLPNRYATIEITCIPKWNRQIASCAHGIPAPGLRDRDSIPEANRRVKLKRLICQWNPPDGGRVRERLPAGNPRCSARRPT